MNKQGKIVIDVKDGRTYLVLPKETLLVIEGIPSDPSLIDDPFIIKVFSAAEELITIDSLTKVPTRRRLEDRLKREIAGFYKAFSEDNFVRKLFFLMIDIDYFKKVNDTHGHQIGDEVLYQIAQIIANAVKSKDVVARWGGEEFGVLGEGDIQQGEIVAKRIREKIEEETRFPKGQKITISSGVASTEILVDMLKLLIKDQVSEHEIVKEITAELIEKADRALYKAKFEGRNRVIVAE